MVLKAKVGPTNDPYDEQVSEPFTVTFADPCESTEIRLVAGLPQFVTSVLGGDDSFTFQAFDTISTQLQQPPTSLGPQICGPFTYSIEEPQDPDQTFARLDDRTITVNTDDKTNVGPHNMILVITLTDHDITQTFPFDVEIASCILEQIQFQGSISEQSYNID